MIRAFNGKIPQIANSAFVSEQAYIVGDVVIGEDSSVWPGAVIRGDFSSIKIGKNCHIEDNSVIHAGTEMSIGDNVLIGHSVVIHGLKIGNNVLVGNNATILDHAEIGDCCIISANSLVTAGQNIPGNSFVVGCPAEIKRALSIDEVEIMRRAGPESYFQGKSHLQPPLSYSDLAKKYREQGL